MFLGAAPVLLKRDQPDSAFESIEASLELQPEFALGWMHYANMLGLQDKHQQARDAIAQSAAINPAMTPDHFVSLIEKIAADPKVVETRTAGLKRFG